MDSIALTDFFLQGLKRLERAFLSAPYAALSRELQEYAKPDFRYADLPDLGTNPKLLIFKPDDIGDAVYALPAVKKLREHFPGAVVHLICQKKCAPVYEASGMFDKIVPVDVRSILIRFQSLDLDGALKALGEPLYDAAFFLRTYPAFFPLFQKLPAKVLVHPKDPRMGSLSPWQAYVTLWGQRRAHQAEQMLEVVSRATGVRYHDGDVVFPEFKFKEKDHGAVEKTFGTNDPGAYVVLHPYARFETRRYPYSSWQALVGKLRETFPHVKFVIIGGKEDPSLGIPGVIEMQGKLRLGETGYLISRASAFMGNESGPGHWAAAMSKPVITILSGHSHESEWGVWGSEKLNVKKDVPCQNCYLRACPKYKVRCLTELSVDDVSAQSRDFLSRVAKL